MSAIDDIHVSEIKSIIGCNDFLFDLKLLDLAPAIASPPTQRRTFPDGEIRPVVLVPTLPRMDVTSYPSLTELLIDLMASVSFFYAEETVAKKYRIAANMVIAIGRRKNLGVGDSILHYRELHAWTGNFFSEEFSRRFGLSASNSARCAVHMETLRGLGEKFLCPQLYVSTPVYDPVGPTLKGTKDTHCVPRSPSVNNIAPLRPSRCGLTPSKSRSTKGKSNLANVSRWYNSQNLKADSTRTAVVNLVKRYRFLRNEGFWPCTPVRKAPPPMFALLENGDRVTLFGRRSLWKLEWAEYYSLEAFFGDVMCAVAWLLSVPGEYEKRCRLAVLLDCVARHWSANNAEQAAFWEEMFLWMWKFIDMDCLDLNHPDESRIYLERCDEYLEDFQQRFVSRTPVCCPFNIWGRIYLPPRTVWRRRVMHALYGRGGTVANPLYKDAELRTAKFVSQLEDFVDSTPVGNSRPMANVRRSPRVASVPSTSETALLGSGSCVDSPENGVEESEVFHAGNESEDDEDTGSLDVPPPPSLRGYITVEAVRRSGGGFGGNVFIRTQTASDQHDESLSEDENHSTTIQHDDPYPAEARDKRNRRRSTEVHHSEPNASQTLPIPVEATCNSSGNRASPASVSREGLGRQENDTSVSVKQETVEVVDLLHSPSDDETESVGSPEGEASPELNTEVNISAPNEVNEPPSADTKSFDGNDCRKRRLDDKLGCDYRERMGSVQTLIKSCRDYFPRHLSHFDALDDRVTSLLEYEHAPAQLAKMVSELLDGRCLENVLDLFNNFLKKFSALVDPTVKDEMETCLDALNLVLDDSQMLVDFQVQYDKKQRRQ